jgi:hypothetical protein
LQLLFVWFLQAKCDFHWLVFYNYGIFVCSSLYPNPVELVWIEQSAISVWVLSFLDEFYMVAQYSNSLTYVIVGLRN